jgi:hypothetical protein
VEVSMSAEIQQRWSKRRKMEVVMRLFRGESLDDVSRDVSVEISRLERWWDRGMRGLEEGLREREGDPIQVARTRRIDGSASSPWRSICSGRRCGDPGLSGRGGRKDERRDLPEHRSELRNAARQSDVGGAPLDPH